MSDSYPALCKTTTATTGTSDYILNTANLATDHRTPKQAVTDGSLTDGDIVQYVVRDSTVTGDASFEKGEGVYTDASNTIARNSVDVEDGSNGPGVLVSWPGSGTRDVYIEGVRADKAARTDRANTFTGAQAIVGGASGTVALDVSDVSTDATTKNCRVTGQHYLNAEESAGVIATQAGNGFTTLLVGGGYGTVNAVTSVGVYTAANSTTLQGTRRMRIQSTGKVALGSHLPSTDLHVQESSTDTTPTVEVEQLSTGDAGVQLSIPGDSFSLAIDNSDEDTFKVSYAASAGGAVAGTNDYLTIAPSGNIGINGNPSASSDVRLQIKSSNANSFPFTVIRSGGSNSIASVRESGGDGRIEVEDSAGSILTRLSATTDPAVVFSDGSAVFSIGIDATDSKLHIENTGSTFGSPLVSIDSNRTVIKTILSLTQTSTAADPTTTEYPNDGDVGVHHNTTSGNRFYVWNDGGTIFKVQMT
jgi:hypothetical protein